MESYQIPHIDTRFDLRQQAGKATMPAKSDDGPKLDWQMALCGIDLVVLGFGGLVAVKVGQAIYEKYFEHKRKQKTTIRRYDTQASPVTPESPRKRELTDPNAIVGSEDWKGNRYGIPRVRVPITRAERQRRIDEATRKWIENEQERKD